MRHRNPPLKPPPRPQPNFPLLSPPTPARSHLGRRLRRAPLGDPWPISAAVTPAALLSRGTRRGTPPFSLHVIRLSLLLRAASCRRAPSRSSHVMVVAGGATGTSGP